MNMQAKRAIEKLLIKDIAKATGELSNLEMKELKDVQEKILQSPDILPHVKAWKKGIEIVDKEQEILRNKGIETSSYNASASISTNCGCWRKEDSDNCECSVFPEINAHRTEYKKKVLAIEELQKRFTLNLYADTEEAGVLFESLAKELSKILR
jgi:hypothetical protein